MAGLRLEHIYKVYPNGTKAVSDFTMDIKDKEFIVFVGPSGCGKSTTLRMIAGLEEISAGELYIDNHIVNDVEPKDRDIAMVFQNYALYPHMTVYENIAFGLKLRKMPKEVIEKIDTADLMQLREVARISSVDNDINGFALYAIGYTDGTAGKTVSIRRKTLCRNFRQQLQRAFPRSRSACLRRGQGGY